MRFLLAQFLFFLSFILLFLDIPEFIPTVFEFHWGVILQPVKKRSKISNSMLEKAEVISVILNTSCDFVNWFAPF